MLIFICLIIVVFALFSIESKQKQIKASNDRIVELLEEIRDQY